MSGTGSASAVDCLGDAVAVDLSGDSRQNVFHIRADIIRDREKLKYLQEYILQESIKTRTNSR